MLNTTTKLQHVKLCMYNKQDSVSTTLNNNSGLDHHIIKSDEQQRVSIL